MSNGAQYVAGAAFAVLFVIAAVAIAKGFAMIVGVALVLWLAHRGRRLTRRTIRNDERRDS